MIQNNDDPAVQRHFFFLRVPGPESARNACGERVKRGSMRTLTPGVTGAQLSPAAVGLMGVSRFAVGSSLPLHMEVNSNSWRKSTQHPGRSHSPLRHPWLHEHNARAWGKLRLPTLHPFSIMAVITLSTMAIGSDSPELGPWYAIAMVAVGILDCVDAQLLYAEGRNLGTRGVHAFSMMAAVIISTLALWSDSPELANRYAIAMVGVGMLDRLDAWLYPEGRGHDAQAKYNKARQPLLMSTTPIDFGSEILMADWRKAKRRMLWTNLESRPTARSVNHPDAGLLKNIPDDDEVVAYLEQMYTISEEPLIHDRLFEEEELRLGFRRETGEEAVGAEARSIRSQFAFVIILFLDLVLS